MIAAMARVDNFILREVWRRGELVSLSAFCIEHGLDYTHAHNQVLQLQAQGLIVVERLRGRGQPMRLTVPGWVGACLGLFGV